MVDVFFRPIQGRLEFDGGGGSRDEFWNEFITQHARPSVELL